MWLVALVMRLEVHVMGLEQLLAPADLFAIDAQITELHNQRDAAAGDLWDRVKRVRTGMKSVFDVRRRSLSPTPTPSGTR